MHLQQLLFYYFFSFCFLYVVFDIYIMWFLHSNKAWFYERFSLLIFPFSLFLFFLNIFIYLFNYQFWFSLSSLCLFVLLFLLLLLLPLLSPVSFLHFQCFNLYYSNFLSLSYLCINQIFLNFKHMMWLNIVQGWQ